RLDAELRDQAEQVAEQAAALESSRRRLLVARDDERRRTAAVIDREVLRHLRAVPVAVAGLDPADRDATGTGLHRCEEATQPASAAHSAASRSVPKDDLAR